MRHERQAERRFRGEAEVHGSGLRPALVVDGTKPTWRDRSGMSAFGAQEGRAMTMQHEKEIIDFAIEKRLPSIFQTKRWAEAGGLMSYGEDLTHMYRRAAYFVDRIFKGARPG